MSQCYTCQARLVSCHMLCTLQNTDKTDLRLRQFSSCLLTVFHLELATQGVEAQAVFEPDLAVALGGINQALPYHSNLLAHSL